MPLLKFEFFPLYITLYNQHYLYMSHPYDSFRSGTYDPVSEMYVSGGGSDDSEKRRNIARVNATIAASEEAEGDEGDETKNDISLRSPINHVCNDQCKIQCRYTPEKSAIYYKSIAAYEEALGDKIGDVEKHGTVQGLTYEKIFHNGLQNGDWAYYYPSGCIASSEVYRDGIPVQNYSYYHTGQIACAMTYNVKTKMYTISVFDIAGNRVFHETRYLRVTKTRGEYELVRRWHPNGHLKHEKPSFIIHNYTHSKIFQEDGKEMYGVSRKWGSDGELISEKFMGKDVVYECNWADGVCHRKWSHDGDVYSSVGDTYTLNNIKHYNFLWKGKHCHGESSHNQQHEVSGEYLIVRSPDGTCAYYSDPDTIVCLFNGEPSRCTQIIFNDSDVSHTFDVDPLTYNRTAKHYKFNHITDPENIRFVTGTWDVVTGTCIVSTQYTSAANTDLNIYNYAVHIKDIAGLHLYGIPHIVTTQIDDVVVSVVKYDNGVLVSIKEIRDDTITITSYGGNEEIVQKFTKDDVLINQCTYRNKKKHGIEIICKNGVIVERNSYRHGNLDSKCSEYYKTGENLLKMTAEYSNNKLHGCQSSYSQSEVLTGTVMYKMGKKHGTEKMYNATGAITKTREWVNDAAGDWNYC